MRRASRPLAGGNVIAENVPNPRRSRASNANQTHPRGIEGGGALISCAASTGARVRGRRRRISAAADGGAEHLLPFMLVCGGLFLFILAF